MPLQYTNKGPVDFSKPFAADADAFKDKSILITGAASGLGEAFARELAKLGAFITIADIDTEKGKKIAEELQPNAQFVHCDVTSFASQVSAFEAAIANSPTKSLDHVLANAGIAASDMTFDPEEIPTEPSLAVVNVNLMGVIYTSKLAMHYFRRSGGAEPESHSLLITSSLAGYLDLPTNPLYTISKFGARAVMRTFRWTSPYRVNVIAPWFIETGIVTPSTKALLHSAEVGWSDIGDAAKAVVRILGDKGVHGRAVGVVPEDLVPGGLADLEMDDHDKEPGSKGEWMAKLQDRLLKFHQKLEEVAAQQAAAATAKNA